ncbi:MAG TPA: HEAT repeat domain-containing protein [Longimicrobium sp.]|nr:HEAT repeat domain-containing protein [Longimicrobium sp.]
MGFRVLHIGMAAGALALLPLSAGCAQERGGLASRVDAAPADAEVRLQFKGKEGVCGTDSGNISVHDSGGMRGWNGQECVEGPVNVRLVRRGGRVVQLKTKVAFGFRDEGRRVVDLGRVSARDASAYLLSLAERSTDGEVGESALFPATVADSVTTWPALLRMGRNERIPAGTRRSAVFWLSQQAGDEVTKGITDLVDDGDVDHEVREHAVFALSQRPREESVPALIRIAREHKDPKLRRTAMFWLGQSNDPRALALFEEILSN